MSRVGGRLARREGGEARQPWLGLVRKLLMNLEQGAMRIGFRGGVGSHGIILVCLAASYSRVTAN